MKGKLIGINGRISIREGRRVNVGVGYAIPIHQIKNFLPLLKSGQKVHHAFLGIRFSRELKGTLKGVEIEEIVPDSSAYKAGIRKGDLLVKFQGKKISSSSKLQNLISVLPAETEVNFTVEREGKFLDFKVKLGKRPE
jgi:serine protease Do